MVVTKKINRLLFFLITIISINCHAAVLPPDRADVLYHSYSGGGIDISGPALLVRKAVSDSVSLSVKHYVDTISSASIDVQVILGASTYEEERVENSFSIDLLNEKSLLNFSYTNSDENDFKATTIALGISQDMFGDLTTISMGYAHGSNEIRKTGTAGFLESSKTDNFNVSLTQIFTKNLITSFAFEVVTDEGFLNNPYRKVRYIDTGDPTNYLLTDEVYPNTRTSTAFAVRARYFLPYRAALNTEFRLFRDSWGIVGTNFELGYTHPIADDWTIDAHYRFYSQTKADFYKDIFSDVPSTIQNFYGRDKELGTFSNSTIGFGVSYEFAKSEGGIINKASVNFKFDHIFFKYDDFRDATNLTLDAGTEPLYQFSTNVMQLFISVWF